MMRHARRKVSLATLIIALGLLACGGSTVVTVPTTTATVTGTATTITVTATSTTPAGATATVATSPPTATPTHVPVVPTATATPLPWDTHAFFEANPDCVADGATWSYFNNGTSGTMTCLAKGGVRLTPISTINFSGVTGKLPPNMTLSVSVSGMTPNAIASIILYLNGASGHTYYFDLYSTGEWVMRRYSPETILASGTLSPVTSATLTAVASGTTRTFKVNGTTIATVNDGFTYTAASSSAFSFGGTSGDSAIFSNLSFTP